MNKSIEDFFNHNAENRKALHAIYDLARVNNLLPCFPNETVMISDGEEVTLISREKNGDGYNYTREVMTPEKMRIRMEDRAYYNFRNLESAYDCIYRDRNIDLKSFLKSRQDVLKSIAVVERETGLKVEDRIMLENKKLQDREARAWASTDRKSRRHLFIECRRLLTHFIDKRLEMDEAPTGNIGHEVTKQQASRKAMANVLAPYFSN